MPPALSAVGRRLKSSSGFSGGMERKAASPARRNREESDSNARLFPDVGRRMLSLRPLNGQQIHKEDSVLGGESRFPQPGTKTATYEE
ncbi:MAG TPA: hypothetical protein PK490_02670 [Prosthecobacter sp.]|nr:hypothetical protein [Prosthecobacter sp.]HRK13160.1 hypothetical protein [Prosthecobacter sp.]